MALAGRRGIGCYQVELVAFGVGEGGPPDPRSLEASDGRGAKAGKAVAFRLELVSAQVQVETVLDRFGLGDLLERKPGPATRVDRGMLGVGSDRNGPAVCGPGFVLYSGLSAVSKIGHPISVRHRVWFGVS